MHEGSERMLKRAAFRGKQSKEQGLVLRTTSIYRAEKQQRCRKKSAKR